MPVTDAGRTVRRGRPGAPCKTCSHPKRPDLDQRLARRGESGESISAIARAYSLGRDSVSEHAANHLPGALQVVVERHAALTEEVRDFDALASLQRLIGRAEKLLAAADAWLTDPNDSTRYNLNPRAGEVELVLETLSEDGERTTRRTARLSDVLREIEQRTRATVVRAEAKVADPRRLLLDAVTALKPVVELLGKARGEIKTDDDFRRVEEQTRLIVVIVTEALRPYPEARAHALARLGEALRAGR